MLLIGAAVFYLLVRAACHEVLSGCRLGRKPSIASSALALGSAALAILVAVDLGRELASVS